MKTFQQLIFKTFLLMAVCLIYSCEDTNFSNLNQNQLDKSKIEIQPTATSYKLPSYLPKTGLVGWWPFNGNANDESGNGNNGTVNGASLVSDRNGKVSKAYSFNGVSDYIQTTYLGVVGSNARTFSFWIKTSVTNTTIMMDVISYGKFTTGNSMELEINWGCEGMGVDINGGGILRGASTSDNKWHHIAYTFENSLGSSVQLIKTYFDGVEVNANCGGPYDQSINTIADYPLTIGTYPDHTTRFFNGQIDDIAIWNRALSTKEITALYKGK